MRAFLSMIARSITQLRPMPIGISSEGRSLAEFVKIRAHDDAVPNGRAALNNAAHADDAALDVRVGDDAAVGNDRLAQGRAVDFAAGQETRVRVDRRIGFEETVGGNQVGEVEIGFVKRADRSDVLPVAVKNVGAARCAFLNRGRNDVLAEIDEIVVQTLDQHVAIEDVDAHRRLKQFLVLRRARLP